MSYPVIFLGGPPASGKSTMARMLTQRWGLRWYNSDRRTWEHRDRALQGGNPWARRWEEMTPKERWVDTSPEEIRRLTLKEERAQMIMEDLRQLPTNIGVVAEGSPLRPHAVVSVAPEPQQSLWLLPTESLQRTRLSKRQYVDGAQENMISRARLDTLEIEDQCEKHGLVSLSVDGSLDREEMYSAVEKHFLPTLQNLPRAVTIDERRRLLRWVNLEIFDQHRKVAARPWFPRTIEEMCGSFVCECADRHCDADVSLSILGFAALKPRHWVFANGHGRS